MHNESLGDGLLEPPHLIRIATMGNFSPASTQTLIDASPEEPQNSSSTELIKLLVGERCFNTSIETLSSECEFFTSFFSGSLESKRQQDGSLFFDWDGNVFAHILNYQRSKVFPLFYTQSNGFDYGMYAKILQLADFLGIEPLAVWIQHKHYQKAIKICHHPMKLDDQQKTFANVRTTSHPVWLTEKVYLCPRRIVVHEGDKSRCGKDCAKARGDREDEFKDEIVGAHMWRSDEETTFNHTICWGMDVKKMDFY